MNILKNYTKKEIEDLLFESDSFKDFLLKIKCNSTQSHVYRKIKKELNDIGINYSFKDFKYFNRIKVRENSAKLNEDMFKIGIKFSTQMKNRILKKNIIPYICLICKNDGIWNKKKLTLHLDHINGDRMDNRLENLRFLCPNCHTQTKTYAGRNILKKEKKKNFCICGVEIARTSKKCKKCNDINQRKYDRPAIDQLINDINLMGYRLTAKKYGVTDGSIRKWINKI